MRHLSALFILAIAMLLMVPPGTGAYAQDSRKMPRAVVAVLDYAHILQASDAAKDIRRQVEQYRISLRNAVQAEELTLRDEEAELKRQRNVLSPNAFAEKREQFKARVISAQRRGQGQKRQLDQSIKTAMLQVQQAVIPIVKKLTEAKGYSIVVDKSQVLVADRATDITKRVMAELNKSLRTVAVPKPQ
jgi:Skp family chaperone for outer membrane proteins